MTEPTPEQKTSEPEVTEHREVREPDATPTRKRPETLADIEPTKRTLHNLLRQRREIS
jgi:hypothetical protein